MLGSSHDVATTAFALLVLRCAIGSVIFLHGYNKFFGGGRLPGTAGWFASIGMRHGKANAVLAATTEVTCGVLLMAGFATPIAAAALLSIMTVAIVTVHWKIGYFVFRAGQGFEYCLTLGLVAIVVGTIGPGRWSLDHATGWWHHSRLVGLAVTVVLGLGGAALQLLAEWRPPSPST